MSWTDINNLVKSVIGEVDDISQDLGEMKEEFEDHAMGFIGVTVTLALFSALALLLLCLFAIKRKKGLLSLEVAPSPFPVLKASEEIYRNSTGSEK